MFWGYENGTLARNGLRLMLPSLRAHPDNVFVTETNELLSV